MDMMREANDVENNRDSRDDHRNKSKGSTIFFGIVFIIGGILLDLFFSHILFSFYKNGNEFDPRRRNINDIPQINAVNRQPNIGLNNQNLGPVNGQKNIRQNLGGVKVGGNIDEEVLESKDPKVVQKQCENLELSLDGGLGKDAEIDNFNNDSLGNNAGLSKEDTPPDVDNYYGREGNKVVDPKVQKKEPVDIHNPAFPNGGFN